MEDISELIRKRRNELGLSMQDVADHLNINKSTVCRWEQGKTDRIKRNELALLSEILHLPIELLLGLKKDITVEDARTVNQKNEIIKLINQVSDDDELLLIKRFIENCVIK